MYRNNEGYHDPTAGAAVGKMMREFQKEQKEIWRRQNEIKNRPKIYVVSKYAGEVEKNVANAIRYCQYVIGNRKIPIASHLLYPAMLNDNDPDERELGTMFGLSLLSICDEVWVFGKEHSAGMQQEIKEAMRLNKPIRYMEVS